MSTPKGSARFGYFLPSRFLHLHYNAMRKAIKAHKNEYKIQQNEHVPVQIPMTFLII